MRIGIDIRTLMDKYYSGVPEYTFNIVKEILDTDKLNEYVLFYNSFKDLSDRIPDFDAPNVSIKNTSYPSKYFNYIMQKGLARPKLNRLLDVDVFFMPHINFASFDSSVKSIITIHDLSFLIYPDFFSIKKNLWHRALALRSSLHKYDKIIAVSENTKQDLIEYCGVDHKKISVIHSGISEQYKVIDKGDPGLDLVREKYNLPDKFILYLGTIEPRKNIDGLIKAFEELISADAELGEYELVLAGAFGWKYSSLVKGAQKSSITDKIHFISYVDSADKVYLYNMATIFVFPSFYEGFGFPPLEAMACGLPVLSAANSSLGEVLRDGCFYVDAYNINTIKTGMKELLVNPELRQYMREKGLKNVEKMTWKRSAADTLKIIKEDNT